MLMVEEVATFVLALGGWAVIVLGSVKWLADRAGQRLGEQWTRNRELELEQFRALSTQSQSVMNAALAAFGAGHSAAQERRLVAVESVWKGMVALRTNFPTVSLLADILTDDEFADLAGRPDLIGKYGPDDIQTDIQKLMSATAGVEEHRPFCGELPWALFFAHRALHGRLLVVIESGVRSGRFLPWRKDSGIQQILRSVLTEAEYSSAMSGDLAGWYSVVQAVETKFLREVQAVITGKQATDLGLAEATRILEVAQGVGLLTPGKSLKAK